MRQSFAPAAAALTLLLAPATFAQTSDAGAAISSASDAGNAISADTDAGAATSTPLIADEPAPSRGTYSVFSQEEFRERRSSLPNENDALGRLTLDASASSANDLFAAAAGFGLWWEVNGQSPLSINGFSDIHGSPDSDFWLDVYRLNLEYKPDGLLQLLRVGRQDAEHGLPATFDGVDVELALSQRVHFFAFGGRDVHFFEIDPKVFEDWIASAGFDVRLCDDLKLELDYRMMRDSVPAADDTTVGSTLVTDHTYGASVQWRYAGWLKARAWVRGINAAVESVGFAGRAESFANTAGVEVKLDLQPATLDELDELDNPFYLTLGPSLPHLKASIDGWKSFASPLALFTAHAGIDERQLLSGAETLFNRDLLRVYVIGSAANLGGTAFYVSVTGEYDAAGFNTGDGELSAGANAGWRNKLFRLEAGTYFQRWSYVYYQQPEELANVRGYYADVAWTFDRWLTVRGRYSYEIFDRILQTFTVSLSQAF